ncbi:hypothetical protein ACFLZI_01665 [Nitrospirota bacterium]
MEEKEKFSLEMPKVGIIKGVLAKDIEITGDKSVNLRTCARPYSNKYSVAQLRAIKSVLETYGSGKVHLSPRHNLEIPEVGQKNIDSALRELYTAGLFPGGAGTSVRNIFTCPDWCNKALRPVQEIGTMVSKNFGDWDMPNKVTISFAGCANGCSRPECSDIGIKAVAKVKPTENLCPAGCSDCIEVCRFDALEMKNGYITVNDKCTDCGQCLGVCDVLEATQTGYRVTIGGKEGGSVRFGKLYADFVDEFTVIEIVDLVLSNYRDKVQLRPGSTRKNERISEVIERVGLSSFMQRA